MFEVERYPIDYDAIKKGDVITKGRLVEILGGDPSSAHFHAMTMKFADEIQNRLWSFDKPFTVCIVKGEIAILDDVEATRYNQAWFDKHRRALAQNHRQLLAVDVNQLDPDERRNHDRAALIQGATLAAMVEARREIAVQPVLREHPQLPEAG